MGLSTEERAYWVALSEVDGLGPRRLPLVVKYFGSAKAAWTASKRDLLKIGLDENLTGRIERQRQQRDPLDHLAMLAKLGVRVMTLVDEDYPNLLKQVDGRPNVLYVKGSFSEIDDRALAVVGTRKPTPYGREVTERLVNELISYRVTIVSGLARGVDSIAHRAALDSGGRTIAVMATGIDQVYPPENKQLAEKIVQHGAVVSEFAPGYRAVPGNFPARNRIISGLSLGVLVTEGAAKSGTKITAQHALEQGREVFAVPGPITSLMSEGPADLIKLGAKLTTSVADILEELKIHQGSSTPVHQKTRKIEFETELEKKLYQLLENGQVHVDELVRLSNQTSAEVAATLTMMEVKGLVRHLGGMVYSRV